MISFQWNQHHIVLLENSQRYHLANTSSLLFGGMCVFRCFDLTLLYTLIFSMKWKLESSILWLDQSFLLLNEIAFSSFLCSLALGVVVYTLQVLSMWLKEEWSYENNKNVKKCFFCCCCRGEKQTDIQVSRLIERQWERKRQREREGGREWDKVTPHYRHCT